MTSLVPPRQTRIAHFPARRTATAVMAGAFDPTPTRYVLTSLLNGVPVYQEVEGEDNRKRAEKRARRKAQRAERRLLAEKKAREKVAAGDCDQPESNPHSLSRSAAANGSPSYWKARPAIHIPTMRLQSVSVSPPPSPPRIALASSGASTPAPSESSSVTRSSYKRLRTPDDDDDLVSSSPVGKAIRKRPPPKPKRQAVRKGWKGWVEAPEDEIPPSEKLINLDNIKVFEDRKTRSGKHFDAWV